jgi:hypothetical protein
MMPSAHCRTCPERVYRMSGQERGHNGVTRKYCYIWLNPSGHCEVAVPTRTGGFIDARITGWIAKPASRFNAAPMLVIK